MSEKTPPSQAALTERECGILHDQVRKDEKQAGISDVLHRTTTPDRLILLVSFAGVLATGAAMPAMTIIFGRFQNSFQKYSNEGSSPEEFRYIVQTMSLYFVYLAFAQFTTNFLGMAGIWYAGDKVTSRLRVEYLAAVLRQNIAYFDDLGSGDVATRITSDTELVRCGLTERIWSVAYASSAAIASFVIGFIYLWKLALIQSSTYVAVFVFLVVGSVMESKFSTRSQECYRSANLVAEEGISAIRTTQALGCQRKIEASFNHHLSAAKQWNYKSKVTNGLIRAAAYLIQLLGYALAFWAGSKLIAYEEASPGSVVTVVLVVLMGAFSLRQIWPMIAAITAGRVSLSLLLSTISRQPPLDPMSNSGITLQEVQGTLELRNIGHRYPSRPEATVLQDVNLSFPAGQFTAIVGPSGAGKSTIIGLVERFYQPLRGSIFLDGHNVDSLNLRWYRQQLSIVEQDPVLFNLSIIENIRHGLSPGQRELSEEVQRKLVSKAAIIANADAFISTLPAGYDTIVGERGVLLSGGQKQRIAIARSVISEPRVLLLDEPTSSLDTTAGRLVEEAINSASTSRTTIVVSHRISTICKADNIFVMKNGSVAEQGTHDELLRRQGLYFQLATTTADEGPSAGSAAASNDYSEPSTGPKSKEDAAAQPMALDLLTAAPKTTGESGRADNVRAVQFYNKKDAAWISVGIVFSILAGACYPTQAVLFAQQIATLSLPLRSDVDISNMLQRASFWSLLYLALAFTAFALFFLQDFTTAIFVERVGIVLRRRILHSILYREMTFFDAPENSASTLTAVLTGEPAHLAVLSNSTSQLLLSATALLLAMVISCVVGWKLALVCASALSVVLAGGYLRVRTHQRQQACFRASYEKSVALACESVAAIRTVAALSREQEILGDYAALVEEQRRANRGLIIKSSLLLAAGGSVSFLSMALGVWYGGQLIMAHEYSMFQFFVCFQAILFGTESTIAIFSLAPEIGRAANSISRIRNLLVQERPPKSTCEEGPLEKYSNLQGHLQVQNITFSYPTRSEKDVLQNVSFDVRPGQFVALVSPSGGGKSTIVSLLERFYEPQQGQILLDGKDIQSYDLEEYRSLIGLVAQDSTLYRGTIRENILMGIDGHDISDEDVLSVCAKASLGIFLSSLPDGLNTVVGNKGVLLSGGQKQRIAIARALIRNPKILILDEATSSLDSENDRAIRLALDTAAEGRTTIAIAHRLDTVQRADLIVVIKDGRITERGTHNELLEKNGLYAELAMVRGSIE